MAIERIIIAALITTSLISVATAMDGTATYYTEYEPSACYGYEDQGTMIAAANPSLYNNGAACGMFYTVQCTGAINQGPNPCQGGTVTVKIVDLCPGCGPGQFDLSQQAFSTIANPDAGRIKIVYNQV